MDEKMLTNTERKKSIAVEFVRIERAFYFVLYKSTKTIAFSGFKLLIFFVYLLSP